MCDDNCANFKPDRMRCETCRTINLAKTIQEPRVDMQIAEKCRTPIPCMRGPPELPLHPTCIKVCSREEYKFQKSGAKIKPPPLPHIGHGPITYAVKTAVLVGTVYFSYSQGIWGDQQDVTEFCNRWKEHVRSFHTRRPPTYDKCGNIMYKESAESIISPMYMLYKGVVTTVFQGIVKFPAIMKCMYLEFLEAKRNTDMMLAQERKMKRNSSS